VFDWLIGLIVLLAALGALVLLAVGLGLVTP
jgi:hypothetical protein